MSQIRPGDLALNGALFEGDPSQFNGWVARMTALLQRSGLNAPDSTPGYTSGSVPHVSHSKAVDILCQHVSPELLKRVPHEALIHPDTLLASLKTRAAPFRFLDLPPKLRNRVYAHALPADPVLYRCDEPNKERQTLPPLGFVSRQLQAEFWPIYYRSSEFRFAFSSVPGPLVPIVRKWAKAHAALYLRHLRRITISKDDTKTTETFPHIWDCTFQYSFDHGLTFEFADKTVFPASWSVDPPTGPWMPHLRHVHVMDMKTKRYVLAKHVKTVTANCEAVGLTAEALVMAAISQPRIWEAL